MQAVTTPSAERRLWPRRKKMLPVFVTAWPEDEAPSARGWIVNRSPGGLRLIVQDAVEEGSVLLVRPTAASASTPWIGVRVKNSRWTDDQQEVGCEFIFPSWDAYLLFS